MSTQDYIIGPDSEMKRARTEKSGAVQKFLKVNVLKECSFTRYNCQEQLPMIKEHH